MSSVSFLNKVIRYDKSKKHDFGLVIVLVWDSGLMLLPLMLTLFVFFPYKMNEIHIYVNFVFNKPSQISLSPLAPL